MKTPGLVLICFTAFVILTASCEKDEDDRDKFVGSYAISETWTLDGGGTGTDSYNITISKSDVTKTDIVIENLGNTINVFGAQMNVSATVTGNSFSIPTQSIALGANSVTVTGTGSLNDKLITINYVIVAQWQGQCTGFKQ
ncbi:MAG: hypothetical protein RBR81_11725 [Bacteroidales bacterium]|jgi:hypothetical protein|nr:hypothetical protein [Bacteroidales bacterium]